MPPAWARKKFAPADLFGPGSPHLTATRSICPGTLRLLLIDDHEIVRKGMRSLLERVAGWTVVADAADGVEGLRLALQLKPDVVITDLLMPGPNGVEVARRLRRAGFGGGIVLVTALRGEDLEEDALAAGIDRFVGKDTSFEALRATLDQVGAGLGNRLPHLPAPADRPSTLLAITPRERQVLRLLARGASSKEIGAELGISPRTVDVHRHRLQEKLKCSGTAELTRLALRAGIAEL